MKNRDDADYQRNTFAELHDRQKEAYAQQQDRLDFWNHGHLSHHSAPRLRYFESLSDPSLGVFCADARTRARRAYLSGTRAWHHHYSIDIADVTIDLKGRSVFIRILPADNFVFEFVTSAKPIVDLIVIDRSTAIGQYKACVVNVNVAAQHAGITIKSRIVNQRRQSDGENFSAIGRPQQVDLISESILYPFGKKAFNRWRYPRAVLESFAASNGHVGVHHRDTQVGENPLTTATGVVFPMPNPGPSKQHSIRDTGVDQPFGDNTATDQVRQAYITGVADFPRASAIQLATSALHGDREFGISVDAFGVFNIFPMEAIGSQPQISPGDQNVIETYIQRVTPAIPAWCYKATTKQSTWFTGPSPSTATYEQSLIDDPEFDWRFNSVGSKATTIAYERSDFTFDAAYWAVDASGTPLDSTMFDSVRDVMGVTGRVGADAMQPAYHPTRRFVAPGILEATVEITITGPELEDYIAAVNVATIRQPSTSPYCPMVVGYPWHDFLNADGTTLVAKDTLMAFDIERWGTGGSPPYAAQILDILVFRKVIGEVNIKNWRAMPLLAVDMTTLSFVTLVQELKYDRMATFPNKSGFGGGTTAVNMFDFSFGACVVHSMEIKEYLFPNTLPVEVQLRLVDSFSTMSGYAYKDTLPGTWTFSPLNQPLDGWIDGDINLMRRWWGYFVGYKTFVAFPATYQATFDKVFGLWGQEFGDDIHMLYCDNPRWGWSGYQSALCSHMYIEPLTTFYAHPNGTYAFYNDSWIYNLNGQPLMAGAAAPADVLPSFDTDGFEHVVFDSVHFEIRTPRGRFTKASSFTELYNKAVRAGKAAETLEDGIEELQASDVRATFAKEVFTYPDPPIAGMQWLKLVATLNGATWRFEEPGVQGGTYYGGVVLPKTAGMVGINFLNERWQPDPTTPGSGVPPYVQTSVHAYFYRFANPTVISKLR